MNKFLLITLMLTGMAAQAGAQQAPPPPPPGPGVPPAEALATLPGVSAAQQEEIRKILVQRRDAQEDAHAKLRAEFEALHVKERNEHERIDAQATAQLRKLLGDEGYRTYAEWTLAHRGPHAGPARGGRPEHGAEQGPERAPPPPGPSAGRAAPADTGEE